MSGKIPAITWNTPNGVDKLGVLAKSDGLLFVRRDDQGQLGQLFVPFVFTPTKFGGQRTWFRCPGCSQGCRVLYGVNSLLAVSVAGLGTNLNTRRRPFASSIGRTRSEDGWASPVHLEIPCPNRIA
jgi:hypothetical protein